MSDAARELLRLIRQNGWGEVSQELVDRHVAEQTAALRVENARLRAALQRSIDTLENAEDVARLLGREILAEAMRIAKEDARSALADSEGQGAGEEKKAWAVKLICCGRDAGEWRCATWEEADALRNSYVSAEGHERVGVVVAAGERALLADPEAPHE